MIFIHGMWDDMYMCVCAQTYSQANICTCECIAKSFAEWIHPYEMKSSLSEMPTSSYFLDELFKNCYQSRCAKLEGKI